MECMPVANGVLVRHEPSRGTVENDLRYPAMLSDCSGRTQAPAARQIPDVRPVTAKYEHGENMVWVRLIQIDKHGGPAAVSCDVLAGNIAAHDGAFTDMLSRF